MMLAKLAKARVPMPVRQTMTQWGLDHKSAKGRPAHVGLRAQDNVLQGSGDAWTEQGGRNYDQGPTQNSLIAAVMKLVA